MSVFARFIPWDAYGLLDIPVTDPLIAGSHMAPPVCQRRGSQLQALAGTLYSTSNKLTTHCINHRCMIMYSVNGR